MRIEAIVFKDFPPFADGFMRLPTQVESSERAKKVGEVHLLTGQNGTGKTRLLCLLAGALGNDGPINRRFTIRKSSCLSVFGSFSQFLSAYWKPALNSCFASDRSHPITDEELENAYQRDDFPEWQTVQEQSFLDLARNHDPVAALAFRGLATISDEKIVALGAVNLGTVADHLDFDREQENVIGQSMANLKLSAAMDSLNPKSGKTSRAFNLLQKLESAISSITGRQFSINVVPNPDVHLEMTWGNAAGMVLNQLPDGLRSIMGWLVACIAKLDAMYPSVDDPLSIPLILLLDEPETHLHPAWQRKILPAAQALFPQAQIIVATHSPFVISSVNEGWIHVFRADENGQVLVDPPLPCAAGDSYLDVIEDILGVKEWYDPETEILLEEFRQYRDGVLSGSGHLVELEDRAKAIASRSSSLQEIMAREIYQTRRLLSQRFESVATPATVD